MSAIHKAKVFCKNLYVIARATQSLVAGNQKAIFLNMEAIGDNVEQFAKTLMHEAKHAKQMQEYREAKAKKVKSSFQM